eukprot:1118518-Amphidinium_carterae.1
MQQVISTSSLKELQRQGSFISSTKWSEGYVWMDVAVELIYNGQQQREKVDITHFVQIKSVWGSTMPSPFTPDPSTWLASHLIDYSIISSNVHVYLNSILEIAQHPTIKNKLAYFCHNIFGKSI